MKHFIDVLNSIGVDISLEFNRMRSLITITNYHYLWASGDKGLDIIIDKHFDSIPVELRHGAISYSDFYSMFVQQLGYDYRRINVCKDMNELVSCCEFYLNLLLLLYRSLSEDEYIDIRTIDRIISHIRDLCKRMNYDIKKVGYADYRIVPQSAEVNIACENLPNELVGDVFTYHHYSFEGDIEHKKVVLSKLYNFLEPRRKELEEVDDELEDLLFFFCNNYFVRHNNENNQSRVNKLSETELIGYYDKIYSLFIEACLRLDNKSYRDEISILKSK